jgi:hypothetical protein
MALENLLPLGEKDQLRSYLCMLILLELIDKCVGSQIWVIMNGGKGIWLGGLWQGTHVDLD